MFDLCKELPEYLKPNCFGNYQNETIHCEFCGINLLCSWEKCKRIPNKFSPKAIAVRLLTFGVPITVCRKLYFYMYSIKGDRLLSHIQTVLERQNFVPQKCGKTFYYVYNGLSSSLACDFVGCLVGAKHFVLNRTEFVDFLFEFTSRENSILIQSTDYFYNILFNDAKWFGWFDCNIFKVFCDFGIKISQHQAMTLSFIYSSLENLEDRLLFWMYLFQNVRPWGFEGYIFGDYDSALNSWKKEKEKLKTNLIQIKNKLTQLVLKGKQSKRVCLHLVPSSWRLKHWQVSFFPLGSFSFKYPTEEEIKKQLNTFSWLVYVLDYNDESIVKTMFQLGRKMCGSFWSVPNSGFKVVIFSKIRYSKTLLGLKRI